jgi:integrase
VPEAGDPSRHFCASSMLAEGCPITAVAGHLGDTVETVQRIYAHWLRDDLNVPATVLDGILAPEFEQRGSGWG